MDLHHPELPEVFLQVEQAVTWVAAAEEGTTEVVEVDGMLESTRDKEEAVAQVLSVLFRM
jgi:hypothetical protein